MAGVLMKDSYVKIKRQTERLSCDDKGRDWRDTATSERIPKLPKNQLGRS